MSTSQIIIFTKCRIGYNPTKYSTGCVSKNLIALVVWVRPYAIISWFCFCWWHTGNLHNRFIFFSWHAVWEDFFARQLAQFYAMSNKKIVEHWLYVFAHFVSGGKELTAITQLPVHRHLNTMTTQQAWHPVYSRRRHIWGKPQGTWRVIIQ